MNKVLLISNKVLHYRSLIYNKFYELFKYEGFEFHVASNNYQETNFPIEYKKHEIPFGFKQYKNFIQQLNPDVCIFFLHLKDKLFIPLIMWCKIKKIPVIYWGHGINLETPNAFIKNSIFHFIHNQSDAIILYSKEQEKYLSIKNRKKVFIANNTLCLGNDNLNTLRSRNDVKKLYGIQEKKIILYISRILPYKGLDILLKLFRDTEDLGLVIVGPGINQEQMKIVNDTPNYYYLGEKYGKDVDEIYNMGDIFSTPGHIGLALVQAMFWAKPVVLLNKRHAPEIVYLHNGENGFIVNSENELKETVVKLINDNELYKKISNNARKTYENEMQISVMFNGFIEAIKYALQ